MELDLQDYKVESSTDFEEYEFGLGDTRLIIETLSKNMYSRPIKALTQELWSNALDANVESGSTKPVEIKVPNSGDSSFWIKDFGPGISPSRAKDIYTKFGSSTKRDTDSQIGKFGFGSKSPWAYTDQFTVETITLDHVFKDKDTGEVFENCLVERWYVATKQHPPKFSLVYEKRLDAGDTGTKVKIDVRPTDFSKFYDAVREVCMYTENKPEIKGSPDWYWPEIDRIYTSKNFFVVSGGADFNLCLNGIPYKLDMYALNDKKYAYGSKEGQDAEKVKQFLSYAVLHFNKGEIPITPSRESVEYRDGVADTILKAAKKAMIEFSTTLQPQIDAEKDYWSAYKKMRTLENNFYWCDVPSTWNGQKLEGVRFDKMTTKVEGAYKVQESYYDKMSSSDTYNYTGEEYFIVFDDTGNIKISYPRCRTIINKGNAKLLVIRPELDKDNKPTITDYKKWAEEVLKEMVLPNTKVEFLSEYEPTKVASTGKGTTVLVKKANFSGSYSTRPYFTGENLDFDNDSGVYLFSKNKQLYTDQTEKRPIDYYEEGKMYANLPTLKKEPLYQISAVYRKRLEKSTNKKLISFDQWCRNRYDELLKKLKQVKDYQFSWGIEWVEKIPTGTNLTVDAIKKARKVKATQKDDIVTELNQLARLLGESSVDKNRAPRLVQRLNKSHPMVKLLNRSGDLNDKETLEDVIKYLSK